MGAGVPDYNKHPKPLPPLPPLPPLRDGQRHVVQQPRTLMSYNASHGVGSLIRPVFFGGRMNPSGGNQL